jgi:hypothetical protein
VRKGRARGQHLGKSFVDPGRDVTEVDRHEVMGEFVSQGLLESLSSGIAAQGEDVGIFGFVADAFPPPKSRDLPVQMPPESPPIRVMVDPQEAARGGAKMEVVLQLLEKGLRFL